MAGQGSIITISGRIWSPCTAQLLWSGLGSVSMGTGVVIRWRFRCYNSSSAFTLTTAVQVLWSNNHVWTCLTVTPLTLSLECQYRKRISVHMLLVCEITDSALFARTGPTEQCLYEVCTGPDTHDHITYYCTGTNTCRNTPGPYRRLLSQSGSFYLPHTAAACLAELPLASTPCQLNFCLLPSLPSTNIASTQ